MIQSLLIANRGEIAGRVISTCRRLGIRTIAVFSEADREALYVRQADEAVFIGPAPAGESYLNIEAVIEAAQRVKADAIHPGYGFLAENADFARRVREAGIIFVGPSAEVIEQMGSKVAAREVCQKAGVPTVPGSTALPNEGLLDWADEHGYPVMLKASAGGGGKGMRRLHSREELEKALDSSRREAQKAFGNDELYLEKALVQPRHLEVQIVADGAGRVLHLGIRECSLQRRHQKLIEESPPPNVSLELWRGLTEAAVKIAQEVNYTNLGTVEFLVDGDDFYFLEMNTRLQVEHPVTEMITGTDLVQIQLQIADGLALSIAQHEIMFSGHAIEARVTCEDPYNGFLPATGPVLNWTLGTNARFDSALETGAQVTPHYDSMVAKIIAVGEDRATAIRSLQRALGSTVLLGVQSNIDFLRYLLELPEMRDGKQHTELVESLELVRPAATRKQLLAAAATRWAAMAGHQNARSPLPFHFVFEDQPEIKVGDGSFTIGEEEYRVRISVNALEVDGHRYPVTSTAHNGLWWVHTPDGTTTFREVPRLPVPGGAEAGAGSLRAPMPGNVVEIMVEEGQTVEKGQALLKIEAMKMEQVIASPGDGTVEKVHFAVGDQVDAGEKLISLSE